MKPTTKFFANEQQDQEGFSVHDFSNGAIDAHGAGGWVLLAPYGNWPNADGLQKFERSDAEAIVGNFNSFANTVARFMGLPWYVGHPDHPSFAARFKDTASKGRIKQLEAREDGLWANVKWNDEGKKLISEEAFHGHSVNWKVRRDGAGWRPVSLKSVGFTNEPNIPVPPILVANQKQTMNILQKLLKLLGLAEDAKEDQIEQVANSVVARASIYDKLLALVGLTDAEKRKTSATEIANTHKDDGLVTHIFAVEGREAAAVANVATLTAERDAANTKLLEIEPKANKLPTVEGELTLANGKVSTLETTFANERKHRIELLIANGIRDGKISPATKSEWEKEFANAFDATLAKLGTAPKIVKTHSDVSRHAEKHAGIRSAQDRAEHVRELAQRHIANGMTPADAYARVYREDPTLAQVTA